MIVDNTKPDNLSSFALDSVLLGLIGTFTFKAETRVTFRPQNHIKNRGTGELEFYLITGLLGYTDDGVI